VRQDRLPLNETQSPSKYPERKTVYAAIMTLRKRGYVVLRNGADHFVKKHPNERGKIMDSHALIWLSRL
jgi:hypothetical protein